MSSNSSSRSPILIIPFRTKGGRLFIEIDERVQRACGGVIAEGKPLHVMLEKNSDRDIDIILRKMMMAGSAAAADSGSTVGSFYRRRGKKAAAAAL